MCVFEFVRNLHSNFGDWKENLEYYYYSLYFMNIILVVYT